MGRSPPLWVIAFLVSILHTIHAADSNWSEVQSGHFLVWSNADDGSTRTLAWQFEQIRSALATMWPWAHVDLSKPLIVLAVKDEATMKALAPKYWEQKGAIHPASVWVSGEDSHYILIRADLRGDDRDTLNPYQMAYYSYASLVLAGSFDRDLPLWFSRGMAGVLSNTIVRDSFIKLGPPIPSHLERLRTQRRLRLSRLIRVERSSPEYTQGSALESFDAQTWAFVHFLMFAEKGVHRPKLNQFLSP